MEMQSRAGQILGHFRLMRLLGKGSYAEVYLAENIHLGIQVAIKVLRARVLQDYEQEQLRTDASLMMTLDHPHIVRVVDFGIEVNKRGVDGSTPYLVMEYAPLGTLRHLYPRGTPMPLQKVVSYIKQVAEALQYAHDHVPIVVHHNVKPENMLVRRPDDVALSDFGIAVTGRNTDNLQIQIQELLERVARKEAVTIPGTTYLAPERLQGYTQRASDQYSLAIVAYEWLCGHPPFDGTDLELCNKHVNAIPQSLSKNVSHIPQDVDRVIMKALSKQPADRYESVWEFALTLERVIQASLRPTRVKVTVPLSPVLPQSLPPVSWSSTPIPVKSSRSSFSRQQLSTTNSSAVEIFCCYAPQDQGFLDELRKHLMPLQRQGIIATWSNLDISPGANFEEEHSKYLDNAQLLLLLVSPDFLASDFCWGKEMMRAIEQHQ